MSNENFIQDLLTRNECLQLNNANEAETRKKLIDHIIEDLLGWTEDDITYEERVSEDKKTTFADYIIRTADASILIEAKRVGDTFETNFAQKRSKLSGKIVEGKTGKAITQARDYCRKKSIPFAVVTNGYQWLLFPAVRTDQVNFASSTVIIFDSLEGILGEDLDHFKNLLSREGVIDGNLAIELLGRNQDQFEERRLNHFFKGSVSRITNPIYPLIENEVTKAFSDSIIDSDSNLLEKCYVKNADRKKFDNRIQMHLQKREPLFSTKPKRPMRKRESSSLSDSLAKASIAAKPLAILILGTVGTGKTTFLQYTRRVTSAKFFEKIEDQSHPHWIDIDFRKFSSNENPMSFIYKAIFEYIKSDSYLNSYEKTLKKAYSEDIKALKEGPMFLISKNEELFDEKITKIMTEDYNNLNPYVEKIITYEIKQTPIFLVIDNVDQFEDITIQSKIFSDAMALANRLNINLIIAMRESTYVEHRNSPVFDAFDFDPIHIEPPEIPSVLSRRFFLAGSLLRNKKGSFTALNGFEFKVDDLSVFIDLVKSSVLGTEIGERIDVLANHDVRLALRMTREFLAKGYTDPAKALQSFSKKRNYTLPKHEAFRSILLGNQSVYSEKYSVIGNPFDSRLGRSNGELLRMFILNALVKQSSNNNSSIDGPSIRDTMKKIGFSENDTMEVLKPLCEMRFIHTKSHGKAEINSSYFASRLGGHIVKELISDFTFLENVLMDTFIAEKDVWDNLKELSQKITDERDVVSRINLRAERVKKFYYCIKKRYSLILEEAIKRNLDPVWLGSPFDERETDLCNNIKKVIVSAKKNYGQKKKGKIGSLS